MGEITVAILFILLSLCCICRFCVQRQESDRNNVTENFNDDVITTRVALDNQTTIEEKLLSD